MERWRGEIHASIRTKKCLVVLKLGNIEIGFEFYVGRVVL
jgi:hypothetical protein